jgi:hypothetical protein
MKFSLKYPSAILLFAIAFLPMKANAAGLCAVTGAPDDSTLSACCSDITSSGKCLPGNYNVKVNIPDDSCLASGTIKQKITDAYNADPAHKQYDCGTDNTQCQSGYISCPLCQLPKADDGDASPGDGYTDGKTCAGANRSFDNCTGQCGSCNSGYAPAGSGATQTCTPVNPMEVVKIGSSWYGVESDLSNYSDYSARQIGGGLWTKNDTTPANIYYTGGNVGIGVTNPSSVLEVAGDIISTGNVWNSHGISEAVWLSVTYGNGLFVAVGEVATTWGDGTYSVSDDNYLAATSPDGINWTRRATPTPYITYSGSNPWSGWNEVAYGNGIFVAVGDYSDIMTSSDGITWTSRHSAADNDLYSVTYGNGMFVAVGGSGYVVTSPDGITWTSRTSAANNTWASVTYGNGLFVAVASSGTGNRVMTSPDGITWASRTSATDDWWQSVTYGNGLFVAVAATGTGNRVMTSPNGITWTSRTSAANGVWASVTYGNGMFVAVGGSGYVVTSPDGITWTSRTTPVYHGFDVYTSHTAYLNSVTCGNGLFVAVGSWTDWYDDINGDPSSQGHGSVMTSGKQQKYEPANNNIYQGGMKILGTVGIGTATPSSTYALDVTGKARFTGGYTTSDIRWKKNITDFEDGLNKVLSLRPVNYEWNQDAYPDMHFENGAQIGFIAQEVGKVVPEAVSADSNGYESINYGELTPVLVKALQEFKIKKDSEISELKKENSDLKSRIEALEAKL